LKWEKWEPRKKETTRGEKKRSEAKTEEEIERKIMEVKRLVEVGRGVKGNGGCDLEERG